MEWTQELLDKERSELCEHLTSEVVEVSLKGIGQRLKAARETRALSLSDAEDATRIRSKYLVALEEGNSLGLPGDAYLKGWLRTYGYYLGLDGTAMVEEYKASLAQEASPELPSESDAPADPTPLFFDNEQRATPYREIGRIPNGVEPKSHVCQELFFCYSHADERLRDELEKHLTMMKRQGIIRAWHDRKIGPGQLWKAEIDDRLKSANVVLLLVSADFLASDYCYETELGQALERHRAGLAHVIPVILRPCDWKHPPIGELQALPRDGKPISTWGNSDEAFAQVAAGIRATLMRCKGADA